jgi:hypothetical protein
MARVMIKRKYVGAPTLIAPQWDKAFQVYVDASNLVVRHDVSSKHQWQI